MKTHTLALGAAEIAAACDELNEIVARRAYRLSNQPTTGDTCPKPHKAHQKLNRKVLGGEV